MPVVINAQTIRTHAIYSTNISLVFNGSCLQQNIPVVDAAFWEISHINQQIILIIHVARPNREAYIVTNQ